MRAISARKLFSSIDMERLLIFDPCCRPPVATRTYRPVNPSVSFTKLTIGPQAPARSIGASYCSTLAASTSLLDHYATAWHIACLLSAMGFTFLISSLPHGKCDQTVIRHEQRPLNLRICLWSRRQRAGFEPRFLPRSMLNIQKYSPAVFDSTWRDLLSWLRAQMQKRFRILSHSAILTTG